MQRSKLVRHIPNLSQSCESPPLPPRAAHTSHQPPAATTQFQPFASSTSLTRTGGWWPEHHLDSVWESIKLKHLQLQCEGWTFFQLFAFYFRGSFSGNFLLLLPQFAPLTPYLYFSYLRNMFMSSWVQLVHFVLLKSSHKNNVNLLLIKLELFELCSCSSSSSNIKLDYILVVDITKRLSFRVPNQQLFRTGQNKSAENNIGYQLLHLNCAKLKR